MVSKGNNIKVSLEIPSCLLEKINKISNHDKISRKYIIRKALEEYTAKKHGVRFRTKKPLVCSKCSKKININEYYYRILTSIKDGYKAIKLCFKCGKKMYLFKVIIVYFLVI